MSGRAEGPGDPLVNRAADSEQGTADEHAPIPDDDSSDPSQAVASAESLKSSLRSGAPPKPRSEPAPPRRDLAGIGASVTSVMMSPIRVIGDVGSGSSDPSAKGAPAGAAEQPGGGPSEKGAAEAINQPSLESHEAVVQGATAQGAADHDAAAGDAGVQATDMPTPPETPAVRRALFNSAARSGLPITPPGASRPLEPLEPPKASLYPTGAAASVKDPSVKDPSVKDPSVKDPVSGGPVVGDQSHESAIVASSEEVGHASDEITLPDGVGAKLAEPAGAPLPDGIANAARAVEESNGAMGQHAQGSSDPSGAGTPGAGASRPGLSSAIPALEASSSDVALQGMSVPNAASELSAGGGSPGAASAVAVSPSDSTASDSTTGDSAASASAASGSATNDSVKGDAGGSDAAVGESSSDTAQGSSKEVGAIGPARVEVGASEVGASEQILGDGPSAEADNVSGGEAAAGEPELDISIVDEAPVDPSIPDAPIGASEPEDEGLPEVIIEVPEAGSPVDAGDGLLGDPPASSDSPGSESSESTTSGSATSGSATSGSGGEHPAEDPDDISIDISVSTDQLDTLDEEELTEVTPPPIASDVPDSPVAAPQTLAARSSAAPSSVVGPVGSSAAASTAGTPAAALPAAVSAAEAPASPTESADPPVAPASAAAAAPVPSDSSLGPSSTPAVVPGSPTAVPGSPTASGPVAAPPLADPSSPIIGVPIAPGEAPPPKKRRSLPPRPPPKTTFSDASESRKRQWWEDMFGEEFRRTNYPVSAELCRREVDFLEAQLGLERGGSILDIACGDGAHAVGLSRRGYRATGIDLATAQLVRARELAINESQKVDFITQDMRELDYEHQFDGAICWNASFGYFEEDKNVDVLRRIYRALKPGGCFLLDVPNRDFIVEHQPSQNWFEGEGCVCMDDMHLDFITSRLCVKRTVMLDDGRNREWFYSMRVYGLHELGRILHTIGFRVSAVSGDVITPGVFFDSKAPRIIALVRKP